MSGSRPANSSDSPRRAREAARAAAPARRHPTGNRARQAARASRARRRRTGWIITLALIVAVTGTILGLHLAAGPSSSGSTASPVAVTGKPAPDGEFTNVAGQQISIASLRGHPTLLWFVATWCPSCQTGAQAMAQNINRFKAAGVNVVTLELYQDLGQSGPSIDKFGSTLAGPDYNTPTWQFGTATAALTRSYDPKAYLDIYYLLDRTGTITYINGSPGATMNELLAHASSLR